VAPSCLHCSSSASTKEVPPRDVWLSQLSVVILVLSCQRLILNLSEILQKSAAVNSSVTPALLSSKTNVVRIRLPLLLCETRCCSAKSQAYMQHVSVCNEMYAGKCSNEHSRGTACLNFRWTDILQEKWLSETCALSIWQFYVHLFEFTADWVLVMLNGSGQLLTDASTVFKVKVFLLKAYNKQPGYASSMVRSYIQEICNIACDRNLLNYPFPSELIKTTQSDIIVVSGDNVETWKSIPSVFYN